MLLRVCFLGVSGFVQILRRQPSHRGVILVEQSRVSREQLARPVPVVFQMFSVGAAAAGPLTPVYTSNQTGAESGSQGGGVSVERWSGGSVDADFLSAERLLRE